MKQSLIALALIFYAPLTFAADSADLVEIENEIGHRLAESIIYQGAANGYKDNGEGTFCRKGSFWIAKYHAELADADVQVSETGETRIQFWFKDSWLDVEGYRRGGILCEWSGGGGTVSLGALTTVVYLRPDPARGFPLVDLESLKLDRMKFSKVRFVAPAGISFQMDEAPEWLNEWTNDNLNSLIRSTLASSLRPRINSFLTDRLQKILEKINENGPPTGLRH
jgi:hypothetical protein